MSHSITRTIRAVGRAAVRRFRAAGVAACLLLLTTLAGAPWALPVAAQEPAATDAVSLDVPIPILSAPGSGYVGTALTDPPTGVPTLRWNPIPNADRYNVQISASQGFATPVVDQITYATSFTPQTSTLKTALPDGTYYWRVRAEDERLWGLFSEPWSFTKDWNAGGTLKPALVEPAADASLAAFNETVFRWDPVIGAAYYRFEISSSPTFNDTSGSCYYKADTLIPQHTPTKLLVNTTCYWRVTPRDNRDAAGVPSDIRSFTFAWDRVPALLTPPPDAKLRFLPRFTWEAVEGAHEYILEISTQGDFSSISLSVTTPNTEYTPEKNLGNNQDFYWRVKAVNPRGVTGPQGEVRQFRLNWTQPPTLLTPASNSNIIATDPQRIYPFFSWTPVAGAERYHIQIGTGTGFADLIANVTLFNATSYTQPEWKKWEPNRTYVWQVEALDAQGNTTGWTDPETFFIPLMPPPNLVYPEPYYTPDAVGMPVHTDRTIAHPVFVWDTTHRFSLDPNLTGPAIFEYPDAYQLTVGNRDFSTTNFSITTAGQAAAPTLENPFNNLVNGQVYYWKVVPLKGGVPMSETVPFIWQTRIDTTINQFPATDAPTPMHPRDGFVATGTPPVLGWRPINGADHYVVQISREPNFVAPLFEEAKPQFVYYAPHQGQPDPMPFGLYWWRFQGRDANDQPIGGWSDPRHFVVAVDFVTGNPFDYQVPGTGFTLLDNGARYDKQWSFVAASPVEPSQYDLGALHMVQDRSLHPQNSYNWIVAFQVNPDAVGAVSYGVYLDIGHQPDQGGGSDPRGNLISTDPRYRPEYVFYIDRLDENITGATVYGWDRDNTTWRSLLLPFTCDGTLPNVCYDAANGVIQFVFTPSGLTPGFSGQTASSFAVAVVSTGTDNAIHDSIPQQTGNTIGFPAFFSDMPMPLYPFDTPFDNPFIFHEMPAVRWRMPYFDSTDGYQVEIARDSDFTEIVEGRWETFETNTSPFYGLAPTAFHTKGAMNDEESYYWRVRYRHERYRANESNSYDTGPWSPPMRFKLAGYQPGTPTATIAAVPEARTTPSFYWERVEGAAGYTIQIDDDANLSSPFINKKIDGTSFTPVDTLADGTYYWRVAMRRSGTVTGQWSPIQSFTKRTLTPTLLRPISGEVINQQPVFAWTPVITNTGDLRLAAPKYRLQWDDDLNFGSPVTVDTESTAYALIKGQSLESKTWYWRVAVIDADNRVGAYTEPASFYIEYLPPTLISPAQGSAQDTDVNFVWTPLAGAAEYEIEIADNEAFNRAKTDRTDSARYTPTFELKPANYYWRVRMRDEDGKTGPFIVGQFSNGESVFLPALHR